MTDFGRETPPSLRKMDMGDNGNRFGSKPSFSIGNIAGDPFWLGTIGIALVSAHRRPSMQVDSLT